MPTGDGGDRVRAQLHSHHGLIVPGEDRTLAAAGGSLEIFAKVPSPGEPGIVDRWPAHGGTHEEIDAQPQVLGPMRAWSLI